MKVYNNIEIAILKHCLSWHDVKVEETAIMNCTKDPINFSLKATYAFTMTLGALTDREIEDYRMQEWQVAEYFNIKMDRIINALQYHERKMKSDKTYRSIFDKVLMAARYNVYILNEEHKSKTHEGIRK